MFLLYDIIKHMIFSKLFAPKNFLGIDIGTASIKVVELSGQGDKKKLENYGEIDAEAIYEKPFRSLKKNILLFSSQDIASAIKAIIDEAGIKTRHCIFSIPDFSTFFTTLDLPPMTKEELSEAVAFEARQHIPLPLEEITLDWELIKNNGIKEKEERSKVVLVAVPNKVINQYREIAKLTGLQPRAMEAEVFSLIRSLIPTDEKDNIAIVDIGAHTTTCSIIDKGVLRTSYSFDISAEELTKRVSKGLFVDRPTAQRLKEKYGIEDISLPLTDIDNSSAAKSVKEILISSVDIILKETEKVILSFKQTTNKEVKKIIIAGGTSLMPGLKRHFENYFKKETEIANPFLKILRPPLLEEVLEEMGPRYAIAVGAALRELEKK